MSALFHCLHRWWAGRGAGIEGRAVIQTYEPENPIIEMAAAQNYREFYSNEILLRRSMLYPPFADICVTAFIGADREKTKQASYYFAQRLSELAKSEYGELPMRVLGPSPALITKLSGKYRYRIIIKFKNNSRFREMMTRLLEEFGRQRRFDGVTAFADTDPDTII